MISYADNRKEESCLRPYILTLNSRYFMSEKKVIRV